MCVLYMGFLLILFAGVRKPFSAAGKKGGQGKSIRFRRLEPGRPSAPLPLLLRLRRGGIFCTPLEGGGHTYRFTYVHKQRLLSAMHCENLEEKKFDNVKTKRYAKGGGWFFFALCRSH